MDAPGRLRVRRWLALDLFWARRDWLRPGNLQCRDDDSDHRLRAFGRGQWCAEQALERTNKKFISRFTRMEKEAALENKLLHDMNLEEMDALWNRIKKSNL